MHSGLLSLLCCRGFPEGTAPDAGSTREPSSRPHQHLCFHCAPVAGTMINRLHDLGALSIFSLTQAPVVQDESQCWCLEAFEALPVSFSLDGGGSL